MKACDCKNENQTIIEALQKQMESQGFITEKSICEIAKKLNVPVSEVYGVSTFYTQFKTTVKAKYVIEICTGTACFILGAGEIVSTLEKYLGIKDGQNTNDNLFYLGTVRCLGCCGKAPVLSVNGKIYEKVTPQKALEIVKNLQKGGIV